MTSSCFVPLPIFLTAKHLPSSLAPPSWGKATCLHGLAYCLGSLVMGNPNISLLQFSYIFRGKSVSLCSSQCLLPAFEGWPHPSTARLYLLVGLSGSWPTVLRIRDCTPHCSCARKSRGGQVSQRQTPGGQPHLINKQNLMKLLFLFSGKHP